MELVRGIRITEHCDQHRLPTHDRLKLFLLVCQAIQHAHQKGIIHRDIKPSNVLVTLHEGVPVPKVIDFGIAKATQGKLTDKTVFTQFQQFIGTPAYISPEQAEMSGRDVDTRADIYSLGVLLYELLVGQTPFDAKEMMRGGLDSLRQIIREKEPVRPSTRLRQITLPGSPPQLITHHSSLATDLDWIVMKCLEKDRTRRYSLQCIDLGTGQELWQTPSLTDNFGVTALDVSPDGRVLASTSGFSDPVIRVWDAATGELLRQLDGHTETVYDLMFSRDGRHLIAAVGDQTIRFWDTGNWTETEALRGHTGEVWAIAISEVRQLIASASKDGDLLCWPKGGKRASDGYRRLPENLGHDEVRTLDHSRILLLPPGQPPEVVDLKRNAPPLPLPEIGPSMNVLGCFGTNIFCSWDGTNQIVVRESRGEGLVQHGAIVLHSGMRPAGFSYNPARQLLAWTEDASSTSLYLASLAAPGRRIELKSDVPGLVPFLFSADGTYLAAKTSRRDDTLRVWRVESTEQVATLNENFTDACFAAKGNVLVVALHNRNRSEIAFYDLAHPDRLARRVPGGFFSTHLAVSPDGGLVSATPMDGQILLLDPVKGKLDESLRGHLVIASSSAFSPDGGRLCSTYAGKEAVKLWDVATRQELLTLEGSPSGIGGARWSADGNAILAGPPWQVWRAPSWEEIAAAEAKDPPASESGGQTESASRRR